MGEKIIIGPINKGLRTDRLPFIIDNDSFPVLINAYQWRGRVKRKRGTSFLNRLSRFFNSLSTIYSSVATQTLGTDDSGNLLTGFINIETLTPNANLVPGTITIHDQTNGLTYTDDGLGNILQGVTISGSVNYVSGLIIITGRAGDVIDANFIYYPILPVMGLRDFINASTVYPGTIAFDTKYSYNITTFSPYTLYDISFYKNPTANSTTMPSYVAKTLVTPTTWNGQNYQQFLTINYQGAMWTTNGITVPFTKTNIGMQFASPTTSPSLTAATWVDATTMTFTITGNPLVVGDFVFVNEFTGGSGLNFQTGYVTVAGDTFTVVFPFATIADEVYTLGLIQYLTNRSNTTIDCLRWYDGDQTNGSATNPVFNGRLGWVNFAPPLSQFSYSISKLPQAQYYLVGARLIFPFKGRLLFFGPIVQTSTPNSQVYLQDTIIFSQNGTPYYTASYTNEPIVTNDTPTSANIIFNPLLVPINQTATSPSWFEDQTGFGGFYSPGIDLPILTVSPNEDALIVGFFNTFQTKLVYSGNDIQPFDLFIVNSELGSASTFSTINLDKGVLTRGGRGFVITNQTGAQRFDLLIPDQVFQINTSNNGNERFCSQRDFVNEWVYFTYTSNQWSSIFPNQTLLFNYRDDSWATFNESYTTYGTFRVTGGYTWATIGQKYKTWGSWNVPWNAGATTLNNPQVIAGNQQGFIVFREGGTTNESQSLYIEDITSNTITSPNHGLNRLDYFVVNGVLGTIGPNVNGMVFQAGLVTANTITFNPTVVTGTYPGGGLITRMYIPFIQTKQFPVAWGDARKTRLGVQQYLLSKTYNSQIRLNIYLSQSASIPYNLGPIVPSIGSTNNSLIYSNILYTCPESANLGLTPFNTNLLMNSVIQGDTASSDQQQIWHRVNTSLIGDTVQVGFDMSDTQMRQVDANGVPINAFAEIELHSIILDVSPSQVIA